MLELFIFSILLHIIDDFVLQPISLSNLKQKNWWIKQCEKKGLNFNFYKNDYKCALLIHSLSWSIMIMLPLIIAESTNILVIFILICYNSLLHYGIDNEKANKFSFNLCEDQLFHFLQIISTYMIIFFINNSL